MQVTSAVAPLIAIASESARYTHSPSLTVLIFFRSLFGDYSGLLRGTFGPVAP